MENEKHIYQGDNIKNVLFENIGETYARIMIILSTIMNEIQKLEPGEDTICEELVNCPNSILRAIEGYLKFFVGLDNSDVKSRMKAQWPTKKKVRLATHVIQNNGSKFNTKKQVNNLWNSIQTINN